MAIDSTASLLRSYLIISLIGNPTNGAEYGCHPRPPPVLIQAAYMSLL